MRLRGIRRSGGPPSGLWILSLMLGAILGLLSQTGCTSRKVLYHEGDAPLLDARCNPRGLRYADRIAVTLSDGSVVEGRFLRAECDEDSATIVLTRGDTGAGDAWAKTRRINVESVVDVRYGKADYAGGGAAIILGVVGVILMLKLAGVGGSWFPSS